MPPLTDDDLASATNEENMRLALLVVANAALDLAHKIAAHDGLPCLAADACIIAGLAESAARGELTAEHIARFKAVLVGEPEGHG